LGYQRRHTRKEPLTPALLTTETRALAAAPEAAPRFTSLEFLALFTDAEQLAVATAAMASAPVKLWYDKMLAASFITLDDPRTDAGLGDLVSAGLLTVERKAEIVEEPSTDEPPPPASAVGTKKPRGEQKPSGTTNDKKARPQK
jgi:hypothetical protein